jgi:hypothetical protein
MSNRELLMLAHKFDAEQHNPAGMYVSIKCDGQRCWWDGGVSRGVPKVLVPWANNKKDERYIDPPIATGLWSRYGNVIHAPEWFLNGLPKGVMLDGELYIDRGKFQETASIIKTINPGNEWRQVKLLTFDLPSIEQLFREGRINNPNFSLEITSKSRDFVKGEWPYNLPRTFQASYKMMVDLWHERGKPPVWRPLKQIALPEDKAKAIDTVIQFLDKETNCGGEGLMLRVPWSYWVPLRTKNLLKVKKLDDDEGIVIGCISGKEGKEGKLKGLMGALMLKLSNGKVFEISGFTDAERQLMNMNARDDLAFSVRSAFEWAASHPGMQCPDYIQPVQFPIGSKVRFRYRSLTNDGLPKEARYWRG